MGNNITVIPKKPARYSLLTSTEKVVYMPLATEYSHGIVKIGENLIVRDGEVSLDLQGEWYQKLLADSVPTHVKNIKESDIIRWNNKAELSDIPDVSEFITVDVDDLANYYLKNDTYSKNEVNHLVGAIKSFKKEIVDELPTENVDENTIYFVPKTSPSGNDYYDEYLYINGSFEYVGTTSIDLKDYVTIDNFNKLVNNEIQIKTSNGSFISGGAKELTTQSEPVVAIGYNAEGKNLGVAIGPNTLGQLYAVAIGSDARSQEESVAIGSGSNSGFYAVSVGCSSNASGNGVAIGYGADTGAGGIALGRNSKTTAQEAIQIGLGTNNIQKTLQVATDNIYNWDTHTLTVQNIEQSGNKVYGILQGETAPSETTAGSVGQFYLDTVEKKLYQCIAGSDSTDGSATFTWQAVGSGVSQEDFDKLVNNETQIGKDGKFKAGQANTAGTNSIAIGLNAYGSFYSTAIGSNARAGSNASAYGCNAQANSNKSIALGCDNSNFSIANAGKSIQIGTGTNSTENTLQIFDDNIYNHETHTLTVQNIEQGGNKVYGILQGATAPDTSVVGEISQFYLDTVAKKLYQCTAINTETIDEVETTTYDWQSVGGGMEILTGSGKPTETTVGEVGQMYLRKDSSTGLRYIWICTGTKQSKYMWENIGGGNSLNGTFVAGGAHPASMTGTIAIGNNSSSIAGGIIIGGSGQVRNGVVLGRNATCNSDYAMVINPDSGFSKATATKAIQIGAGTNSTANTLQIRDDNIYNMDTHTLTVQNIELNGVDLGSQLVGLNTALEAILGV